MPDSNLRAFIKQPVPPVRAGDVKRVWSLYASEQARDTRVQAGAAFAVCQKLLVDLCDENANVLAVWCRATVVGALLREGRLERWRQGNGLRDEVFELAATFPIPRGLEGFDLDAFVAALR